MQRLKQLIRIKNLKILLLIAFCFSFFFFAEAENQLGASLYIAPLAENPRVGNNFTATIKVDSLAESVNAVKGVLTFNKDRLEIINTSKIGSILNLWVDEPSFSNIDGTLKFQGGVPNPGFIGNGGTVLHIIFKAKGAGITSLVWKEGEVLASDGKGTNILTNLQNLDFLIDELMESLLKTLTPPAASSESTFSSQPLWIKIFIGLNIILLILALIASLNFLKKSAIKSHDRRFHGGEHEEREIPQPLPPSSSPSGGSAIPQQPQQQPSPPISFPEQSPRQPQQPPPPPPRYG